MAGNLPKADPAFLLNLPHCKPSQVSGMDEEQISSLLLLESALMLMLPERRPHTLISSVSGALTLTRVLKSSEFEGKSEPH